MLKKLIAFVLFFLCLISLSGCATTNKQDELEMQGLKNQLSVLETQIQSKDEEINNLRDSLSKAAEEKASLEKKAHEKKAVLEVKSRPTVKQIQEALEKAGYNPGSIDGRMGKQTREAIKAFQKANNLPSDGKTGQQTWDLLKEYLYKKIK